MLKKYFQLFNAVKQMNKMSRRNDALGNRHYAGGGCVYLSIFVLVKGLGGRAELARRGGLVVFSIVPTLMRLRNAGKEKQSSICSAGLKTSAWWRQRSVLVVGFFL